jgi:hypothetical protein
MVGADANSFPSSRKYVLEVAPTSKKTPLIPRMHVFISLRCMLLVYFVGGYLHKSAGAEYGHSPFYMLSLVDNSS